jgi:hypothetical protein
LGLLIKRQPYVRELSASIFDSPGRIGAPGPGFVGGNLAKMTNLTVFAIANEAYYDPWFPHTPSLEALTVQGKLREPDSQFGPRTSKQRLRIQNLSIRNVRFMASSRVIDACVDLVCLKELELEDCKNMAAMMAGLANAYMDTEHDGPQSLDLFEQCITPWIKDLEILLQMILGLEFLSVSAFTGEKLQPTSICDHGATLHYLVMEPLNKGDYSVRRGDGIVDYIYDKKNLRCLAKQCPLIKEFGTSLAQINFEDWPHTELFVWHLEAARSQRERSLMASIVS